ASVQVLMDQIIVYLIRLDSSSSDVASNFPKSIYDLRSAAVVQSDVQSQTCVLKSSQLALANLLENGNVQLLAAADHSKLNVVLLERLQLLAKILDQQVHQCANLISRPFPVLG